MPVRLIATDLDGTLVRDDHHTISARTRAAFAAARDAGIDVVAISGRQPYSIGAIVVGSPLEGPVIGSNGSVAVDLASRSVLFEELLEVEAQRALADGMLSAFPEARVTSVRSGGNEYVAQDGYSGEQDPGAEMALWPVIHRVAPLADVLAEPSVKLVIRHPDPAITPTILLEAARDLAIAGVHATTSGAPFLEVGRAGVTKATALFRFARERGIAASDVVAFGDNLNDVEMLTWAGLGVAMGNAVPGAKQAADEVTASNEEDGVALVLERLLSPVR